MEWYSARIGDPVTTRVLLQDVRDQVRRAKLAARLPADAQVYVITEMDAVRFLYNDSAAHVLDALRRIAATGAHAPRPDERINPIIDR